jgi:hypothetical protein
MRLRPRRLRPVDAARRDHLIDELLFGGGQHQRLALRSSVGLTGLGWTSSTGVSALLMTFIHAPSARRPPRYIARTYDRPDSYWGRGRHEHFPHCRAGARVSSENGRLVRLTPVAVVISAALLPAACGGSSSGTSTSSTSDVSAVSQHDRDAAGAQTRHQDAWERAYKRWDKAYLANKRPAFLAAAATEMPTMEREADATYRAAVSVDDSGLRSHYVKIAHWYLRKTSAINLINTYVRRSDQKRFEPAVHKLDRIRAEGPKLAEDFQNYYQRRFGTNPFSDTG